MRIRISWPRGSVTARLGESSTVDRLADVLPIEAKANTWGEEVYFSTPVRAKPERDARQVVDPGTVCFWPPGNALALPYGRTPVSEAGECRLASPCNVLGALEVDAGQLADIRDGDTITVERLADTD
ncbi:MAG: hypothetical protein GC151_14045 [Betaproteobacteria bacterium]|nr:hypothetical protein [Betaproteobacteria bacterium]